MRSLPWPRGALTAALLSVSVSVVAGARLTGRVEPRQIAVHSFWVDSGNRVVTLAGNGATDLDCYIYDPLGTLLGFDNGISDRCLVRLRQRRAGNVRIEVENLGDARNEYRLDVE